MAVRSPGRTRRRPRAAMLAAVLGAAALPACFAPVKPPPAFPAVEQQVTSAAVSAAVARIDFDGLETHRPYRVQVTAAWDAEKGVVRAALEQRLAEAGYRVVREEAPGVALLEAVVSHAGSDIETSLLGVPIFVPGLPLAFGDISLWKSSTVTGRARLGIHVWDADARFEHAIAPAQADRKITNFSFFTFIGPFLYTDVESYDGLNLLGDDGEPGWSGDELRRPGQPPSPTHRRAGPRRPGARRPAPAAEPSEPRPAADGEPD